MNLHIKITAGSLLAGALLLTAAAPAVAHGPQAHNAGPVRKEQKDWGIAAERREARRTITVRMGDDMRFYPDALKVREGEVIRLVVRNTGQLMHELVIGTTPVLEEHAALMVKFPDMVHDEPYMAHVPPGGAGEIVWRFNRAGDFRFACLMAGHYQAGMVGTIQVSAK